MTAGEEIIVRIAPNGGQATLSAPAGLSSEVVTPETLKLIVQQAGVLINQDVERDLAAFAAAYGAGDSERTAVIAMAEPPVLGDDGRVEWAEDFDPSAHGSTPPPGEESATGSTGRDHYAGLDYVRIKIGDVIGVVYNPTDGTDGCDVRGRAIKSRPGTPLSIKFGPTISINPEQQIIAQTDGVLILANDELSVSQSLDIPGDVDFSIGNIDFAGSVAVAGGIRPGFAVKAKEHLRVAKLIECAKIECGGNLIAQTGMVGRNRGTIAIGCNVQIPYLDNVKGVVSGDLTVEREIIDCRLTVGNDLKCPNGAILGGELIVTGSLVVKVLGSEGWIPTTILLGDVPLLRGHRRKVVKGAENVKRMIAKLAEEERMIRLNPRPSHSDREKLTEFSFEVSELQQELQTWTAKLEEIDAAVQSRRKLDVHIAKTIYPKVMLGIGDTTVLFKNAVSGPLWICWDAQRRLVYRTGSGDARPLTEIGELHQPPEAPAGAESPSTAAA